MRRSIQILCILLLSCLVVFTSAGVSKQSAHASEISSQEIALISTSEPSAAPFSGSFTREKIVSTPAPVAEPVDDLAALKSELSNAHQRVKTVRRELKEARASATFHQKRATRVTAQKRKVEEKNQNLKIWLVVSIVVILACVAVAYFLVKTALSGISQPETWTESGRSGLGTREYAIDYYRHQLAMYQHYLSYLTSLGLAQPTQAYQPLLTQDPRGTGMSASAFQGYGSMGAGIPALPARHSAIDVREASQPPSPALPPLPPHARGTGTGNSGSNTPVSLARAQSAYPPAMHLSRTPSAYTPAPAPAGPAMVSPMPGAGMGGNIGMGMGIAVMSPSMAAPMAVAGMPALLHPSSFGASNMSLGSPFANAPSMPVPGSYVCSPGGLLSPGHSSQSLGMYPQVAVGNPVFAPPMHSMPPPSLPSINSPISSITSSMLPSEQAAGGLQNYPQLSNGYVTDDVSAHQPAHEDSKSEATLDRLHSASAYGVTVSESAAVLQRAATGNDGTNK